MSAEVDQFAPLREAATKLLLCQIGQLPVRDGERGFHIWVQGVVVAKAASGNQALLDDGTGIVLVEGLSALINEPWLEPGKLGVGWNAITVYKTSCTK